MELNYDKLRTLVGSDFDYTAEAKILNTAKEYCVDIEKCICYLHSSYSNVFLNNYVDPVLYVFQSSKVAIIKYDSDKYMVRMVIVDKYEISDIDLSVNEYDNCILNFNIRGENVIFNGKKDGGRYRNQYNELIKYIVRYLNS